MYDKSQTSHIRRLCLVEYNEIQSLKKKQNKIKLREKAFYYSLIAIMVGIVSQYVIDVLFKVSYPWQVYYSIVISSAFIGYLKVYLPAKLLSVSAVIITTIVYQTIAYITGEETLTSEELIESIVADIFIVQLIIYIYTRLRSDNNDGEDNNKADNELGNIFVVTLSSSIVINVASFLSKNAYSKLFGFKSSNSSQNVLLDDN